MKVAKLKSTPITEETFIRQRWYKSDIEGGEAQAADKEFPADKYYFFLLPLVPDNSNSGESYLVSNSNEPDVLKAIKELNLDPGQFFVEIMNSDGLGFCSTEEELEILYGALTGKWIEDRS